MCVEVRGQLSGLGSFPSTMQCVPQEVRLDGRCPYPQVFPALVCFLDVYLAWFAEPGLGKCTHTQIPRHCESVRIQFRSSCPQTDACDFFFLVFHISRLSPSSLVIFINLTQTRIGFGGANVD